MSDFDRAMEKADPALIKEIERLREGWRQEMRYVRKIFKWAEARGIELELPPRFDDEENPHDR